MKISALNTAQAFQRRLRDNEKVEYKHDTIRQAYDFLGIKDVSMIMHGTCFPVSKNDMGVGSPFNALSRDVVEFEKTYFDRKTHRSQILSMRSTDILFGYHGAAFVNIMFMMPYSGFIEVFSPISRPRYYDMMAIRTQLAYRCLTRNTFDRSKKRPRDGRNLNIFVDVNMVVEYVNQLAEIVNNQKYKIVNVI